LMISPVTGSIISSLAMTASVVSVTAISFRIRPDPHTVYLTVPREGSATPTTSLPSSITVSNQRPHDRQDQDEPGHRRNSSPASSHKRIA
ncbi:hypothetical protein, partial [Bowdeniella massiliensis]|uniref:hypothetical protein n=1 Tax=Bowdeniella massiliensis TaxID=2932264 RepID=UPI0020295A7F